MRFSPAVRMVLVVLGSFSLLTSSGCGQKKKAKKGGLTIKQQLEKAESESTPDLQANALIKVAKIQLTAADTTGAKESTKAAFAKLQGDGDASRLAPQLIALAHLCAGAKIADKKMAREALKRAISLAETITDPTRKTEVLAEAGGVYGSKDGGLADPKAAKETLAKAAEVAESIEPKFRTVALAAVALGYTKAGQNEDAKEMISILEEGARALEEPRKKAEALAAAAKVRFDLGNKTEAIKLLTEASVVAKGIERSENRGYALLAVAITLDDIGDTKKALSLLKEADKAADKVSDPDSQKKIVEKVRTKMAELEKKK